MKRILSIIIAAVIAAAMIPVPAFADDADNAFAKEYEVLSALGISMDAYAQDKPMTRACAAKVLAELAGMNTEQSGYSGYFDVPQSHEYAGAIKSVTESGIMRGTENGLFEPDRAITYAELARTVLVMLNYDVYAEARGGYIAGYISTADRLKLARGTGGLAADTELSGGAFARVLYNALDIEVLQISSIGANNEYETIDGETLSYKYLGVRKNEGRVNATSKTAISGSKVSENQICIDSDIVNENGCSGAAWLGYTVEYWAVINDDDTMDLLYIAPNGEETTLSVRGDEVSEIRGNKFIWRDGNKDRTITMSDDMACIYNGEAIDYTAEDLRPKDGNIEFIINDAGRAGIAIVHDYRYGVVRSVNTTGNRIIFDDMSSLRLDDYDDWQIIKNKRSVTIIELGAGDILNIQESRSGTIVAEVAGGKVSGRISGFDDDEGRSVVTFDDGTEQIVSPSYNGKSSELALDTDGEWYTNILGDIFYAQKIKGGTMRYGYMISYRKVFEPTDEIRIKVFTEDGEFAYLAGREKIVLVEPNGSNKSRKDCDELEEYFEAINFQPQLIKYDADSDGTLNKIQLSKMNYNRENGGGCIEKYGTYGANGFTLDYIGSSSDNSGYFMLNLFGCSILVGEGAPVFRVPEDKSDEKAYSVDKRESITKKVNHDVELYDVNDEYEAQACVMKVAGASANYDWSTLRVAMVDKNRQTYLEDEGIAARELSVYQDGKSIKLYCEEEDMVTQQTAQNRYQNVQMKDLKPGDVIAFSADSSNMIKNFELLFSYNKEKDKNGYFEYSIKSGVPSKTDYSSELYIGYGVVKVANAGGIVVNANADGSDTAWDHYFVLESKLTRTLLFDTDTNRWKTVPFTTAKRGDKVVIRAVGYGLWEVLIYE